LCLNEANLDVDKLKPYVPNPSNKAVNSVSLEELLDDSCPKTKVVVSDIDEENSSSATTPVEDKNSDKQKVVQD
jgi:hypothetical protein